jgi:hypothetical protein
MTDYWAVGLVLVASAGSFFAGWMARQAQIDTRREARYWREVNRRPALYDWSSEEDLAE